VVGNSYSFLFGPVLALIAVGLLSLVLRWAFSPKKTSLVEQPVKPGEVGEYGMLVAVSAPDTWIEVEIERLKLRDAGIRVTVAETLSGPRLMVFPKDEAKAHRVLGTA
jgi:hypothetical protein